MLSSTVSRGAGRDHRGLAEEFAAADEAGIQVCCQVVESPIHHVDADGVEAWKRPRWRASDRDADATP